MILDSIEKIITTYFACITKKEFIFKGRTYFPKPLRVSSMLWRGYTCPVNCGGCCFRVTLDYLPKRKEKHPYQLTKRMIRISDKEYPIWSDLQDDHDSKWCRHRQPEDGRCAIHLDGKPFAADFELIRFLKNDEPYKPNQLTQKLFGRGWSYERVDGEFGALCAMLPITKERIEDTVRRLRRLKVWAEYFEIDHCLDEIIAYPLSIKGEVDRSRISDGSDTAMIANREFTKDVKRRTPGLFS